MATFHTLPLAARDAAPDPLTPARHRLRQAIAPVDRARRETEPAAEQIHRLTAVVAEHDRLQAQLRELYTRDQAARGEWIAGGRIQATEAKTHLPQLLDEVERGETIIITRHGHPISPIIPKRTVGSRRSMRRLPTSRSSVNRPGKRQSKKSSGLSVRVVSIN